MENLDFIDALTNEWHTDRTGGAMKVSIECAISSFGSCSLARQLLFSQFLVCGSWFLVMAVVRFGCDDEIVSFVLAVAGEHRLPVVTRY